MLESMKATSRNIGLLSLARARMSEDRKDKLAGIQVRIEHRHIKSIRDNRILY